MEQKVIDCANRLMAGAHYSEGNICLDWEAFNELRRALDALNEKEGVSNDTERMEALNSWEDTEPARVTLRMGSLSRL